MRALQSPLNNERTTTMKRTEQANTMIELFMEAAFKVAWDELIMLCREVMQKHKKITQCCIAMGTVAFYEGKKPLYHDDKRVQKVEDFVSRWDGALKLSGCPARFTATSEITTDW